MVDVYEMPTPKVPADPELDDLADRAQAWATSTEVAQGARQCLRLQSHAIRALRIKLASIEAKLASTEAIAAIARDERTAVDMSDSCPGVGCPPKARAVGLTSPTQNLRGQCPICDAAVPMDGEVIGEHTFAPDSPVPAS
jgi:hypothetical protein